MAWYESGNLFVALFVLLVGQVLSIRIRAYIAYRE